MNRRLARAARRATAAAVTAVVTVACSGAPESGPAAIAWDRDTCEHCYMTISDRRSAAQLRVAEGSSAHAFDELGCALLWLRAEPGELHEPAELFVRSPEADRWVDAKRSRFARISGTPMDYGFVTTSTNEGMQLSEVSTAVFEMEDQRRATGGHSGR